MQRRREVIQLQNIRTPGVEQTSPPVPESRSASTLPVNDHDLSNEDGHEQSLEQDDISTVVNEHLAYPETDRGRGAWLCLAACCIVQLPIWGFSIAFGIFQDYYTNQDPTIRGDKGSVPVIGATCTGVLYLLSPVAFSILTKYPQFRPYCGALGLVLAVIGYVASSFADQVWALILTQGIIASVGCGLLFSPTTLYLNEWFIDRKGLALGIMWAGKSFVGVVMPFVAQASLDKFGSRTTIRAWAVIVLLSTLPVLKFIKPRIPVPAQRSGPARPQLMGGNFLRMPSFWIFQASNIIQGLGYFIPTIYMFSYSTSTLGYPAFVGTLVTSAINASSVLGGIVLGMLCDRYPVPNILLLSSVGSALSVLVFWGLTSPSSSSSSTAAESSSYACLALFTVAYGFFAGGFSSTWSGILTHLKREAPGLESGLMFGLLAGGRGIGNVISGPVSAALLSKGSPLAGFSSSGAGSVGGSASLGWLPGYGTEYGGVIVFTGVTALMGGAASWFWQQSRQCVSR